MASDFPPMTPFALAFAAEYKGFMRANNITGAQIAEVLNRGEGYVSERVNGKRALDTNDVDALAALVRGWTGPALLVELSRRAERARSSDLTSVQVSDEPELPTLSDARARFNRTLEKYGFEGQIAARGGVTDQLSEELMDDLVNLIEEAHNELDEGSDDR